MRIRTALVLAGALTLTAAGPAAADSIVYVKGKDIWVANPDGSGQQRVTKNGSASRPYGSPSQADDGTIVASRGEEIVRLRRDGKLLSHFNPPGTSDSAGQPIDGVPQDIAVSPDGKRIAFTYYQYGCPVGASCGARTVLLYSSAKAATPAAKGGKLFRRNASWISNSRILAFNGYLSQVNVDSPGGGDDDDQHWFDDQDLNQPSTDLGDGELSRQGDRLVLIRNYGADSHLQFYAVSGDLRSGPPPGPPAPACHTGADASVSGPSWSPDGRAVAFAISTGIETMSLPNVRPGDCGGASSSKLVIRGGSEPDWGPAAARAGTRGGSACRRLNGAKRDRCVRSAALAKCAKGSKRRRSACVRAAKRSYALKQCKRLKRSSARASCVRKVRRRFP